jgi:CDP-diacylglycerol--serine O-phosphatidyltransferase
MNFLANLLSGLSLLFGFVSLIFSLESHFTFAAGAILLSVLFDGLDGQVARLNPVPSEFGKELDSLVDVVSFGIAPAILGYVFIYNDFHFWAASALFVYLACSVFRLAKYNITPKGEMVDHFIGLPTTASGAILASFILIYRNKDSMRMPEFIPSLLAPEFIPILFVLIVLVLAFLMVSRVPYLNLDALKQLFGGWLLAVVLGLAVILGVAGRFGHFGFAMFTLFLIYLLFSPFVVKRINKSVHSS